jgi:radical SAM protein with 4Fe4S-binding SPASM domain
VNPLSVAAPALHGPRSRELHQRAQRELIPIGGSIELTHRCNLACVHCYVNLAPNDRAAQLREMTTAQVHDVLEQLAAAGTLWLTLTGGEPLLRPDFAEIYTHAWELGLITTVYTNATLITDRILELWRARPPRIIEITQYGFSQETYDRVTDAGAQHARFERGVERAIEAGLPVRLKTVAMRSNVHEVAQMRDAARARGINFRFDTIISPRIDGGRGPLKERLTPAEVAAVENDDERRAHDFADYCATAVQHPPIADRQYHCGAGLGTFVIDPYGRLHVCELSRKPGWDVLRHGFLRGVKEAFPQVRAKPREHTNGCGSCATQALCVNCTGMSELEGRSPDDGDVYFCEVVDARNAPVLGDARPTPNGLLQIRRRATNG